MTRENRVNAIFLIVLAVLLTPGFCFLMYRKLSGGGGKSNSLPDPVASAIAYMQPLPAPPVPRAEPRLIRDWVASMARERLGPNAEVARNGDSPNALPIVSDRFVTQFVGISPVADGKVRVWLIVWEDKPDLHANPPSLEARTATASYTATVNPPDFVTMPRAMRHSLQNTGYVDPPTRFAWVNADLPADAATATRFSLTRHVANRDATETLTLPKPLTPTTEASR